MVASIGERQKTRLCLDTLSTACHDPASLPTMKWTAYVAAWLAATVFWSLASASGAAQTPLETLPYALLAMGSAAVMGVVVWRITARVPWNGRAPAFYVVHLSSMAIYSAIYSTTWTWPDIVSGHPGAALTALRHSSFLVWNLLMGSWLYVIVAGISYGVRARRESQSHERAAADAQLLAREAQLAALRAQINPHFLFNALHSVGALVTIDPARADQAIECLGDLLRYALGSDNEVPFAAEWRFTEDYLAFERLRLGDRLRVDSHVDADALAILVPPLLLQPLVENAVRHGIADRPEGGAVRLRATVAHGRLILSVSDDGSGSPIEGSSHGLGLVSASRRLSAMYGNAASLRTASDASGFSVHIELPSTFADRGAN